MNVRGFTLWDSDNPDSENFIEVKLTSDILDRDVIIYQIILRNKQEDIFMKDVRNINENIKSI